MSYNGDMNTKRKQRPSKNEDVLARVREHLDAGTYLDTRHATDRKHERKINLPEAIHVLRSGYHEKRKDEFKESYHAWNYAIRGSTVDRRQLRVCISFDTSGMLIITIIDLDADD